MRARFRGASDLGWVLLVASVTALVGLMLVEHLQTRHELYRVARDRSHAAFEQRTLLEQQRHLELEQRIRVHAGAAAAGRATLSTVPPERVVTIDVDAIREAP